MEKGIGHDIDFDRLGRRALAFLTQHKIPLKAENYQVVLGVLTGTDPALRKAFVELGQPITEEAVAGLAKRFGGDHAKAAEVRAAAVNLKSALTGFAAEIGTADLLRMVDGKPELVDRSKLDQALAAVLSAISFIEPTVVPMPVPARARMLEAQLPVDLSDYSALEQHLTEIFSHAAVEQGVSLLLCHIRGLAALRQPQAGAAESYVHNTVGRFAKRLLQSDEQAFWTAQDELGLVLTATSESYIETVCDKLGRIIANVEGVVGRAVPQAPALQKHFGCARTYRPVPPARFYGEAAKMLQRAELREEAGPFFADVSGGTSRRYETLYGNAGL